MSEHRKPNGQFSRGTSGNPRGRPRRERSVEGAILEALNEKVTTKQQGRKRRMTKVQAAATQLVNKGIAGDRHAAKASLELALRAEKGKADAQTTTGLIASDREIADRLIARLRDLFSEAEDD